MTKPVKSFLFIIVISLFAVMPAEARGARQGENRTGGSQLRDISVFHQFSDYRVNGKNAPVFISTWGNFELENGSLPLERTIRNGRKKVYRINIEGRGGIMFPLHGWSAFTLEQYYENGFIGFDVRGAAGGEDFSIGVRSYTRGVQRNRSVSLTSQNIQVTNSWQYVKIPIKNIVGNIDDGFSLRDITMVHLEVPGTSRFYLSQMYITSTDREKQYPVIKVNQLGYEINHRKYALISCFPGTLNLSAETEFYVINSGGEIRFTGRLQPVSRAVDPASGEIVFKADFSALNENGTYYISITNPHVENSFTFNIGSNIYNNLFADTMKYFYFQRQGIDLQVRHAGIFARSNLHPGDSAVKRYSQRNDPNAPVFDVSRGWYDAGDFGKYFQPAASTVTDLLFAYELFPHLFRDNQLNIPESGNGVPDILDEIKWQLDMMLKFEDGTTGSFYEVANYEGDTIYIIDTCGVTGTGYTKSTAAAAWAAGVFAHAYIIYRDIPLYRAFANRCLETAKRAWTYLEVNPNQHTWVNGAGRGYYYDASALSGIKFLAAAALFRATGEEKYQRYVFQNYRSFNYAREFNPFQVTSIGIIGTGFIHYAMSLNPNTAVIRFFEERFTRFETQILNIYRNNSWLTALADWGFFWGSNMPIVRLPVELYICNMLFGRDTTLSVEILRDSVNYILGVNPLSFSFISGYGENSVKNIFSGIFSCNNINEIPRGYLAGGANQYEAGFLSNYVSKCYVDSDSEWTTNEHAIYWNAAMVLGLAVLSGTW